MQYSPNSISSSSSDNVELLNEISRDVNALPLPPELLLDISKFMSVADFENLIHTTRLQYSIANPIIQFAYLNFVKRDFDIVVPQGLHAKSFYAALALSGKSYIIQIQCGDEGEKLDSSLFYRHYSNFTVQTFKKDIVDIVMSDLAVDWTSNIELYIRPVIGVFIKQMPKNVVSNFGVNYYNDAGGMEMCDAEIIMYGYATNFVQRLMRWEKEDGLDSWNITL